MQKSVKRKQNIIFSFTNLDVWHVPNDSFSQSNSEMTFFFSNVIHTTHREELQRANINTF